MRTPFSICNSSGDASRQDWILVIAGMIGNETRNSVRTPPLILDVARLCKRIKDTHSHAKDPAEADQDSMEATTETLLRSYLHS